MLLHFLTMPESPLSMAIGSRVRSRRPASRLHEWTSCMRTYFFFVTGEAVRCAFARVGRTACRRPAPLGTKAVSRSVSRVASCRSGRWTLTVDARLDRGCGRKVRALAP